MDETEEIREVRPPGWVTGYWLVRIRMTDGRVFENRVPLDVPKHEALSLTRSLADAKYCK